MWVRAQPLFIMLLKMNGSWRMQPVKAIFLGALNNLYPVNREIEFSLSMTARCWSTGPELTAGPAALVLYIHPPNASVGLPDRPRQGQGENAHDYGQCNGRPRRAEENHSGISVNGAEKLGQWGGGIVYH